MNEKKTSVNPWWFVTGILLVWLCSPFIIAVWLKLLPGDYSRFGTFGDMFGAINALFSGLTIAGLVYTIILQRQEMREAQETSTAQRKLAEAQIEILETQLTNAHYQRYEETFFKLIDLHLVHSGDLINSFAHYERDNIHPLGTFQDHITYPGTYQNYFEQQHIIKNFGNYLQTFHFIVDTVLTKEVPENREKYFKLYFAQLHVDEKRFLLYHFNFGSTKPNEWNLVKKYLFQGLTLDHLWLKDFPFDGLPPNR